MSRKSQPKASHGSNTGRIYYALPPTLQSGALALYGLRNRRRLRAWTQILASSTASEHWRPDQQRAYVADRLRDVLGHAVRYVPRYAELISILDDIEDPRTDVFELLMRFPPVTREEILDDPGSFLSRAFEPRQLRRTLTSGTTGTPFATWIEPEALLTCDALGWRRTRWAGYEKGDWIARLVGDPVISLAERDPKVAYRVSWTDRRIYFSTYHLNEETARRICECLLQRRPAFLMGYPSALDALARLCDGAVDLSPWRPKAILYSSEPLYEHQRSAIARFIDAPFRGLYGCGERVISAAQCEHSSYHMNLDGVVEGQFGEAPLSESARVTGLLNRAMPLIRYELGDMITPLVDQECACGRTLPLMSPVVTKADDSLITPSGRVISPSTLTWAFKDLIGINKSQIRQRDDTSIEVLLQTGPSQFERSRAVLETRLRQMTFGEFALSFRRLDTLEPGAAGKTRFVIGTHTRGVN